MWPETGSHRGCAKGAKRQLFEVVISRVKRNEMQGARVLILSGDFQGQQGVCLGEAARRGLWAISPDDSDEILSLAFEKDFGLLVDLSGNPEFN